MGAFDSVTGIFSGAGSGIMEGIKIFGFYILPALVIGVILFIQYRNKSIYRYKARIFRIRENGKVKESNFNSINKDNIVASAKLLQEILLPSSSITP